MKKLSKAALKKMAQHPAETQAAEAIIGWEVGGSVESDGLRELTTPPILALANMPIGARIDGTILDVLPSRDKKIRNPLFVMQLTKGGNKVSVPGQAAIVNNLMPEYDSDNAAHVGSPAGHCPHIGKRVVIEKAGTKASQKWKTDEGKARTFAVYNIFVQEPKGKK